MPRRQSLLRILLLAGLALSLQGCTLARAGYVYYNDPAALPRMSASFPIYAEAGAEGIAATLEAALPESLHRVETTHGSRIDRPPTLVVCATAACYGHYAAIPASAAETLKDRRITINGTLILNGERDAVKLLTHELSHYYWYAQGILFQPRWFEEGMGVWVSDGGGAEKASPAMAEQAIRAGSMIEPTLDTGLWAFLTQAPTAPDNNWYLFYRQSGMFVQYLHDNDPGAFRALLAALRRTGDLRTAWPQAYADSPQTLWDRFTAPLRQATGETTTGKTGAKPPTEDPPKQNRAG